MKIQVEIEIFDDPKYCNSPSKGNCRFLDQDWCEFFHSELDSEYKYKTEIAEKCAQCKEAYQEALREQKIEWIQQNFSINRENAIVLLKRSEK